MAHIGTEFMASGFITYDGMNFIEVKKNVQFLSASFTVNNNDNNNGSKNDHKNIYAMKKYIFDMAI